MDFRISFLGLPSDTNFMIEGGLILRMPQIIAEHLFLLRKPQYQIVLSTNGATEPTVVISLLAGTSYEVAQLDAAISRLRDLFRVGLGFEPHFKVEDAAKRGAVVVGKD